jgi:predicted ATPase/Flp pilus assembly protein TadD
LRIAGETAWRVPSLSLPDPGGPRKIEALLAYDGPRLFVERARQVRPDLVVGDDAASAVAEICLRLDGIPLALELAAARTAAMAVPEIAVHLNDRFRLLTGGARTALPRHQTLRATVEWSHEQLDEQERALLRRLSVFAGGFTLDAATEVVVSAGQGPFDVLDVLSRLVGKSLLECDVRGAVSRYRFLETIRAYAIERLAEAGEDAKLRDAHLTWCASLTARAENEMAGTGQPEWLPKIDEEIPNFRAALDWAASSGAGEQALEVTAPLTLYWFTRGRFREGQAWLQAALALAGGASERARGRALWSFGSLGAFVGDIAQALPAIQESAELCARSGDARDRARSLMLLGHLRALGDPGSVRPLLDEAHALAHEAGDRWCLAHTIAVYGWTDFYRGDADPARPRFRECLETARESGDLWNVRQGLAGLGAAAMLCGEYDEARSWLVQALELSRELGVGLPQTLGYLGEVTRLRGRHDDARRLLEEGLAAARRTESLFGTSLTTGLLGRVALDEDDAGAGALFDEALSLARRVGLVSLVCWWTQGLGDAARARGEGETAQARYEEALSEARRISNRRETAHALHGLALLAASEGDADRARSLLEEAIDLQRLVIDPRGVEASNRALAGLTAAGIQ